jgi:hypothetical protein
MSGTLQDTIAHARASADALDDPDDIENHAILNWMNKHVAFSHHHHRYVLVTDPIPPRWLARALYVGVKEDAVAMLRALARDHAALTSLRAIFTRWGDAECLTVSVDDEGMIALLGAALADRRIFLFEDAKSPPIAGKTDPSVYARLNGANGTNVNFAYLARWEGNQYLRGYVPFVDGVTAGRSGMTVATGFDVGQIAETELASYDLPAEAGMKLAPYAGLRFTGKTRAQVAAIVVKRGPVPILTKAEADAADLVVHGKHLTAAIISWNGRRKSGVPAFRELPGPWQTALFSRTFHQGPGMPDSAVAQPFYSAATEGKWTEAVTALQNYNVSQDWYKLRVGQEAAYMRTQMPPPVAPPPGTTAAPKPGAPPARP